MTERGSSWRVWALRAGRSRMDRSLATYLEGMGEALDIPHTMFLLRGPRTVLVDTSFESPEAVARAYPQEIWRERDEEPVALLASLGVAPDDIDAIICTHLHYDHCGTNRRYPHARVAVQRSELEYARAPVSDLMLREFFAPTGGFTPPYELSQFDPVDGDLDLDDGLRLVHLPGHTPGLQGVIVPTADGRIGLLGDHVMLSENWDQCLPVGLHTSVDDWYRSTRRIRPEIDRVAPSHDMRLFANDSLTAQLA